ncbi:MAG: nuclear transport factor 2 family protein, partial [Aeromicrobium sp.]
GRRDFQSMAACLDRDVRFRALVPRGPFELTGSEEAADRFEMWFGGDDEFEVVDASIGQVGACLYFRWRIRMTSASDPSSSRIAEQHVFARVGERIESLDLLCSGFQAEGVAKEES